MIRSKSVFYTNIALIIFLFITLIPEAAYPKYLELENYINQIIKQGSDLLTNQTLSKEEKVKKTNDLVMANLDLNWMAEYTLGRNKRNINNNKVMEFTKIYSRYVMQTYSALIDNYKGEKTKVKSIVPLNEKSYMINTEIVKSDGTVKFKADYLVRDVGGAGKAQFKIADIITEGVSMITSQQAEFDSIIMNEGLDKLMQILNTKIKQSS